MARGWVRIVVVCTLLLLTSWAAAQDVPPVDVTDAPPATPSDTPTPTVTPPPTETSVPTLTLPPPPTETAVPSDTPTATWTTAPSETATASATAPGTLTATVSATATTSATASPTSALLLPPEPPMTVIFADAFDSPAFWTLGAGWSWVSVDGNGALLALGATDLATFVFPDQQDVAVSVRVQRNGGRVQVHLRASALGGYVTTLDADGTLTLTRAGVLLGAALLPPEALAGPWQTLRVSVIGGAVRVSVDDVPWLALLDPLPLPPGSIALRADAPLPLLVDDFTLAVPGFAPSATAAPVPGMTTDATLPLLLDEDFTTPNPAPWVFDVLPAYTDGGLLRLSDGSPPLMFAQGNLVDATVEADVALASGTLTLMVRRSGDGHNRVDLSATGRLDLYRGDQWLQSAQVTPWAAGQPVRLGLSAVGAQVTVSVNGAPLISVQDAAPSPSGMVLLGVVDGQAEVTRVRIAGTVGAPREVAVPAAPRQALAQSESVQSVPAGPGGGQIAASIVGHNQYFSNIYLLNSNGVALRQLTFDNNAYNYGVSLSPDGTEVVYTSSRSGSNDLYIINLVTGITTRLTLSTGSKSGSDWSPDGTRIIYSFSAWGGINVSNLQVLVRATGATNVLYNRVDTSGRQVYLRNPRWSADGQYVTFVDDAIDGRLEMITNSGTYIGTLSGFYDVSRYYASSSIINEVAYCRVRRQDEAPNIVDLIVQRAELGAAARVLSTGNCGAPLAWSPDDSTIAHWSGNGLGLNDLARLPVAGGPTTRVSISVPVVPHPRIWDMDWGVIPSGGICPAGALSSERVGPDAPSCSIPPEPTPTPTATPTLSPQAQYYRQYRGIIFWAIYNETSGNEQIPLHEALPGVTARPMGSINGQDHRYLMARTILDNLPQYPMNDTAAAVAHMRRWGGSIGNTRYRLWLASSSCQYEGTLIAPSYAVAVAQGPAAILLWFNGYAECLRQGQPLSGEFRNYDAAYREIMAHVDRAISDRISGVQHSVSGAGYIKHTSACFVWQRDDRTRETTSCHGGGGEIDMQVFCAASPVGRATPVPDRNCRITAFNPNNVNVSTWLASVEGRHSNQQLGLETVRGRDHLVNLGYYTPDQPLPGGDGQPTSGQGCERNCYFLLGNPALPANTHLRQPIPNETRQQAWVRHERNQDSRRDQSFDTNPDYGYRPSAQSHLVHVLRIEADGSETWITTVFQRERR